MLVEQLRDGLQAVVLRLGQLKRLLASLTQLVDEDSAESGLRTCLIAAGAGEGAGAAGVVVVVEVVFDDVLLPCWPQAASASVNAAEAAMISDVVLEKPIW